jgi:hypothetical protein
MVALGFGVLYLGYMWTFAGYCWIKGYNITLLEIAAPVNWYGAKGQTWPPPKNIPTSQVIPTAASKSSTAAV